MKNFMILLSLVAFLSSCHGHKSHNEKEEKDEKGGKEIIVPAAVKTAFEKQFAKAKEVEWNLEKEGEYEAEFSLDNKEMAALFDTKGNLIETETPIQNSELPQAVKDSLAKEFAGYVLYETEKTDAKGVISYEMEVKKASALTFDAKGKLIKNEVKKDEENQGEKAGKRKENKEEKEEKD